MIFHTTDLKRVFLCTKTASQPKYELLKELVEVHNKEHGPKNEIKLVYLLLEKIPAPEQIERNSVIIFDDVVSEKMDEKIGLFFMRSRHQGHTIIYLS